jgi:hypothetical protein
MTAELGSETIRDSEKESERDVIEVTPEEVDMVGEGEVDSPILEAEPASEEQPGSDQPGTEPPEVEPEAGEPAVAAATATVYCVRCGQDMRLDDRFCRNCGWDSTFSHGSPPPPPSPRPPRPPLPPNTSQRNRLTTLLLCVLLGPFGAHRFYLGKIGTGVLWLVTFGILGFGVVFDLVMIATGECRDIEGKPVLRWD